MNGHYQYFDPNFRGKQKVLRGSILPNPQLLNYAAAVLAAVSASLPGSPVSGSGNLLCFATSFFGLGKRSLSGHLSS